MNSDQAFLKLTDTQIMALTIYGEARGEEAAGRIAVGSVILERVAHRDWDGNTISEVCLKKWQFSCYLESDRNYSTLLNIAQHWNETHDQALKECFAIAGGLINGSIPRTTIVTAWNICQYIEASYRRFVDSQAAKLTGEARKKYDEKRWWIRMDLKETIEHHEFYA